MEEILYKRRAFYHETDKMCIIHHSNYIKWFEEARVFLLDSIGLEYTMLEDRGIFSPVISAELNYKSMVKFHDWVVVKPAIVEYNGIKMYVSYTIKDAETEEIKTTGKTGHCFIDGEGNLLNLKKSHRDIHDVLRSSIIK